jgi:hypothetical protein
LVNNPHGEQGRDLVEIVVRLERTFEGSNLNLEFILHCGLKRVEKLAGYGVRSSVGHCMNFSSRIGKPRTLTAMVGSLRSPYWQSALAQPGQATEGRRAPGLEIHVVTRQGISEGPELWISLLALW